MAESQQTRAAELRKNVVAAQTALREAVSRVSFLEKSLAAAPSEDGRSALASAVAERERAQSALDDATAELENHADEEREANPDDPLPQTDYWVHEIVEKLYRYRQRATYRAVGDLRNADAWMVRGWFKGREAYDNSFIVERKTGEPSDYPADKIHPALKSRLEVLETGEALLEWLQTHPLPRR